MSSHAVSCSPLFGNDLVNLTQTGEDCFDRPHKFIPERWYKHSDMVRNKAAFAPFGTGKQSIHTVKVPISRTPSNPLRPHKLPRSSPRHERHAPYNSPPSPEVPLRHSPGRDRRLGLERPQGPIYVESRPLTVGVQIAGISQASDMTGL